MDTYQPIYEAVRSRLSNGDIGQAVQDVLREQNIAHAVEMAALSIAQDVGQAAEAYATPSAIYKPKLSIDGNQWCALYGENLQDGVAGFGDSPGHAMEDFNRNWSAKIQPSVASQSLDATMKREEWPCFMGNPPPALPTK